MSGCRCWARTGWHRCPVVGTGVAELSPRLCMWPCPCSWTQQPLEHKVKHFGENLTVLGKKKNFFPSAGPAGIAEDLCRCGWGWRGGCQFCPGSSITL